MYWHLGFPLKKHLNPTPIVIAERYKFYDRKQKRDETLSEYMAALRKLTEHCEFGGFLNEVLREKYVCGLQNASIRKRLFAERTLDLQRAIEISQGLEQAQNQSDLISTNYAHIKTEDFTNKLSQVHSQRNRTPSRSCYRCAAPDHLANVCRFKNTICNKCHIKGHLAKACRKTAKTTTN